MFVQINHYFSPFVKLLSASRTNVGKTKTPTPPPNFSMLVKEETLFAEASQALTLQTSQPQRNCATYSADWGSGCSELRATECNMCGRVPGRRLWKIANAPLVTLLRVNFLSRIISYYDVLTTMPYLTSPLGQMDFCTIYNDNC